MFEASEALQKPKGTKKIKNNIVPLIFMKFWSRNNMEELDRLTAQDVYYIQTYKHIYIGFFFLFQIKFVGIVEKT